MTRLTLLLLNDSENGRQRMQERVFVSPLLIGAANSGAVANALVKGLEMCGLDIPRICECLYVLYLLIAVDGCSVNGLLCGFLQMIVPRNCVVLHDFCDLQALNSVTMTHLKRDETDVGNFHL